MRHALIGGIVGLAVGIGAMLTIGAVSDDSHAAPALCDLTTEFVDRYGERALEVDNSFDREPLEKLNLILSIREKSC